MPTSSALLADRRARSLLRPIVLVLAGTLALALSARVAIPLPFSPVPISLQTAVVALIGATLGWRLGALTVCAYIAEGAAGLPVFANGGAGLPVLLGPTGGYLAGFVLCAVVAGALLAGQRRGPVATLAAFLAAGASVYLLGLPWLATIVGPERVLAAGLLPFIPGDLVKMTAASAVWLAGERAARL